MNRYKVTVGPATFGPGQVIGLTRAQIEPRAHHLNTGMTAEKIKALKPDAVVSLTVKELIQFKAGEIISLEALERRLEQQVEALDAPATTGKAPKQAKQKAHEQVEPPLAKAVDPAT